MGPRFSERPCCSFRGVGAFAREIGFQSAPTLRSRGQPAGFERAVRPIVLIFRHEENCPPASQVVSRIGNYAGYSHEASFVVPSMIEVWPGPDQVAIMDEFRRDRR